MESSNYLSLRDLAFYHVIDRCSPEEAVEPLEVEELRGERLNEDIVDEVKDASEEVTNHRDQDQRLPTKVVREATGYQSVENRRCGGYPLDAKLDVIDLSLN